MHTATLDSDGDDALEHRRPASHRPRSSPSTDFADVAGKKPVVLISSPRRRCARAARLRPRGRRRRSGPQRSPATSVVFIHQEIYKDNQAKKGFRPQLVKWRLESEPWTFAIDRNGKSSTASRVPSRPASSPAPPRRR